MPKKPQRQASERKKQLAAEQRAAKSFAQKEQTHRSQMKAQREKMMEQEKEIAAVRARCLVAERAKSHVEATLRSSELALQRERKLRLASGAGANPNYPAGQKRGIATSVSQLSLSKDSLDTGHDRAVSPLFRTSLTASSMHKAPRLLAELGPSGSILYRVSSQAGIHTLV